MADLTSGIFLIYFAVTLGVALLIGNWKGRIMASLIWSALLGPIGWIIIAIGPDLHPVKSVDCPHCGKTLPLNQAQCNHCGNRVSWIAGKARRPSRPA